MSYHQPVLLKESVDALNIKPDGVYVDVTFGGGGHSREILKRLGSSGRLVAFDQDPDAKANIIDDPRFTLVDQNFKFLKNWLSVLRIKEVDGILGDLGVSSHQFDSEERGFSIRYDSALDMRMDQSRTLTAEKIVNTYEEHELTRILRNYGELDNAKGVARTIIQSRPIFSSQGLMDTLNRTAPRGKEHKFYAQLFQALRIEVNEEIAVLEEFLQQSAQLLKPEGRLVIISYHSLEDRPVKDFLKTGNFEGTPEKDFYGNLLRPMKPLHTKPILPSQEEIDINNRARSAKLRIGIKL